jgi:hypothetical protein
MTLSLKFALACFVVLSTATLVDAGRCQSRAPRNGTAHRASSSTVAFAVPVTTVVVAVQPAFVYSYREAALTYPTPAMSAPLGVEEREQLNAESILRANCFKCHQGDAPRGGLRLFATDESLERLLPRRAILEMASPDASGVAHMPPGEARKLSDAELDVLRQWAEPPRDLKY